ncbi:hypothetical protein WJ974_03440 [Achromobacter xylosoxidans]
MHREVQAPQRQRGLVAGEVQRAAADRQVQFDLRMPVLECRQPRDQPAHGHRALAGQHQRPPRIARLQGVDGVLDQRQRALHGRGQQLAVRGDAQAAAGGFHQGQPEVVGQLGHAPADRAVGQRQFVGGRAHRAQAGDRLEGAQVVQGGAAGRLHW